MQRHLRQGSPCGIAAQNPGAIIGEREDAQCAKLVGYDKVGVGTSKMIGADIANYVELFLRSASVGAYVLGMGIDR